MAQGRRLADEMAAMLSEHASVPVFGESDVMRNSITFHFGERAERVCQVFASNHVERLSERFAEVASMALSMALLIPSFDAEAYERKARRLILEPYVEELAHEYRAFVAAHDARDPQGCRNCRHCYYRAGDPQCAQNPFDIDSAFSPTEAVRRSVTHEQIAIVRWLQKPGRDAMRDRGCPGFERVP